MPEPTAAFDPAAQSYDSDFTHTEVGRLQRELVRGFLLEKGWIQPGKRVLELNCGTGADAIWMAGLGADVLATDLSGEMVSIGKEKWRKVLEGNSANATTANLDVAAGSGALEFRRMNLLETAGLGEKFDLIFSNFGGLNCISPEEMAGFLRALPTVLEKGGRFAGVIMPRFCAWETLYFLAKFRFASAFRRSRKGPIPAPLGNDTYQDTWYFSPSWTRKQVRAGVPAPGKVEINIRPIGSFLPPSYLDPFFRKRPSLLKRLSRWEYRIRQRSWYAGRADHFLITVEYFY